MNLNEDKLKETVFGQTKKVLTPSGRIFIIREQTGNDDDILSNPTTQSDLSNIDNFLAGIVLKEIKDDKEITFGLNEARSLLKNDRIALLFESRIFSLGKDLKFTFDFGSDEIEKGGGKFKYVEDLLPFIHDYTKPFPEQGEPGYFKYKIPPYPENAYGKFEFTTSLGKQLRMRLMDGEAQRYLLKLDPGQITQNTELISKGLEVFKDGNWVKVENFIIFKPKEMVEIRAWNNEIDPPYNPISEIEHPKTKLIIPFNILNSTDFFYPVEI